MGLINTWHTNISTETMSTEKLFVLLPEFNTIANCMRIELIIAKILSFPFVIIVDGVAVRYTYAFIVEPQIPYSLIHTWTIYCGNQLIT